MSENNAAQVDLLDAFVQEAIDQVSEQEPVENQPTESAPVEDTKKPEATEATEPKGDEPKDDGFQKRINKITKKAGEHERRADDLQKQLDVLQRKPELEQPTLEQHDFDTDAFNDANVDYKIQEGVKKGIEANSQNTILEKQELESQQLTDSFIEAVTAIDSDGMNKINAIPDLSNDVIDAIKQSSNSGELALYLAKNLEAADKLATMTGSAAMMELGRISVQMSIKPEIKTSAAPDPIEPINSGSALSDKMDDEMPIDAWMAKYN